MAVSIIRDGYTRQGYLKAATGFYPDVYFEYRRASLEERHEWGDRYNGGAEAADRAAFGTAFLPRKIVKWDLKDRNGRAVPINAKSFADPDVVDPNLFNALAAIVLGLALPDVPPDAPQEEVSEAASILAEAKAAGQSPGDVQDGRDAKN